MDNVLFMVMVTCSCPAQHATVKFFSTFRVIQPRQTPASLRDCVWVGAQRRLLLLPPLVPVTRIFMQKQALQTVTLKVDESL